MKSFSPIKYLKLTFQFNEERLRQDLAFTVEGHWVAHYNRQAYEGDRKSMSLYAADGKNQGTEISSKKVTATLNHNCGFS